MKRSLFFIILYCTGVSLTALPTRNPAEPLLITPSLVTRDCCSPLHFRLGYEADYVFNRYLQDKSKPHHRLDHTDLWRSSAYLVANCWNRVDVFSTLGATALHTESSAFAFLPSPGFTNGNRFEITTETTFCWSVGARGVIFDWNCLSCGIAGEYLSSRPKVHSYVIDSDLNLYPSHDRVEFREYQASLGLAYNIKECAFPYISAKWNHAEFNLGNDSINFTGLTPSEFITRHNLESSRDVGYAVGFSLIWPCALLTLEWNFISANSLCFNGQFRF